MGYPSDSLASCICPWLETHTVVYTQIVFLKLSNLEPRALLITLMSFAIAFHRIQSFEDIFICPTAIA